MQSHISRLNESFLKQCPAEARVWWEETCVSLTRAYRRTDFDLAFARAPRVLGHSIVSVADTHRKTESSDGIHLFDGRPLHCLARGILLMHAVAGTPAAERDEFVFEIFVRSDNAEKESLLRTLPLLPESARYLQTAVEACRTNVETVFTAIACENPYPARHFPELHFNQMVMKTLFIGLPLARIVGLTDRITPSLKQMVRDHIAERTAAGRAVQSDTATILTACEG